MKKKMLISMLSLLVCLSAIWAYSGQEDIAGTVKEKITAAEQVLPWVKMYYYQFNRKGPERVTTSVRPVVDEETGCIYLWLGGGHTAGITPRLDADGRPMGCRNIQNSSMAR